MNVSSNFNAANAIFPNTEDNPEIIGNIIDDYLKSLPQNTYIKEFRDHLIDVMYEYTV